MRRGSKIALLLSAALVIAVALVVRMAAAPQPKADEATPARPKRQDAPVREAAPPLAPAVDAAVSPAVHPGPRKTANPKPKPLDEAELMERLRKAQDTDDYVLSYDLAREGLRRFPDSPDAPEMAAMVVKSLARQGKSSEARAEAEVMVNKYAGTKWAREVERHTGAHPIRNQVPPP
jgi:hypothetical protein